jgi:hypothetical protein
MKIHSTRTVMILLAAIALAAPLCLAGDAPTVVGVWDAVASTPNGDMTSVMTITEKDGTLEVDMVLNGMKRGVSKEKLDGDVLTMTVRYDGVPYDVELKVDGETMEGTWSGMEANGTLKAKRQP